jgi:hypothetical protein
MCERIGWPNTPRRENFTRAGRENAGTLQEARGKSEGREKGYKRNSVRKLIDSEQSEAGVRILPRSKACSYT